MTRTLALLIGLSLPAAPANGQMPRTFPRPGDRIRITAPARNLTRLSGTLLGVQADTLFLAIGPAGLSIPRTLVTRLEVSRGEQSHVGKGALIGLAAGLGLGGIVGYTACNATTSPRTCFESQEGTQYYFLAAWAASGATGALLGAIIGGRVHSERWEVVPVAGVAAPGSTASSFGIGFRVSKRL